MLVLAKNHSHSIADLSTVELKFLNKRFSFTYCAKTAERFSNSWKLCLFSFQALMNFLKRERYGVKKTVDVYSSEFDRFWPLIETDSYVFVPYFFVVCDINENTDIRYEDWIRKK